MFKQMTVWESKEYHLKKLYQFSLKSLGQIPETEELTYEQQQWVDYRLTHPETWQKVHENKIGDWKHWR
jgi:hypothetical protein